MDEGKRQANSAKYGIDFVCAACARRASRNERETYYASLRRSTEENEE
jgi:uncharacterized DUF497 family protein